MHLKRRLDASTSRRSFLHGGSFAAASAIAALGARADGASTPMTQPYVEHHPPRAKRIIYLCQSGAPSQMDLFDYKPAIRNLHGQELPNSVRGTQRLTTMTSQQKSFPVVPSPFRFRRHGESGMWMSELLPHLASVVDELCLIRSLHTEAINHDPAITLLQTGTQQSGRPSLGAWLSFGLGTENRDLPAFVALVSATVRTGQPLYSRLWGSGFLPTRHQGVQFRGSGDPVLFLNNPAGMTAETRKAILNEISALNRIKQTQLADAEIGTRIAQYELALRMQSSVPAVVDLAREPRHTLEMYGPDAKTRGSYASNCILARRLIEQGVRFVQLFHRGWDQHANLPKDIRRQCQATDQPTAALLRDLKQRGLLDDTLIVWGGEFGRTIYCQGKLTHNNYGRDHHPRCFSMWLAGGGIRRGATYGSTDDFSYNVVANPVHIHDLNATILHCLGIDHRRLTFKFQGRHHRLTDVHGQVVQDVLA